MACCILGAIILLYLLAPVRLVKSKLYPILGKEDPTRAANDAVSWRPQGP